MSLLSVCFFPFPIMEILPIFRLGGATHGFNAVADVWRTGEFGLVCGRCFSDELVDPSGDFSQWENTTSSAAWAGRVLFGHTATADRIYVCGGFHVRKIEYLNDCWSTADGVHWELQTSLPLSPRWGLTLISIGTSLLAMGGDNSNSGVYHSDYTTANLGSSASGRIDWAPPKLAGWTNRSYFCTVTVPGELLVISGMDVHHAPLGDVWSAKVCRGTNECDAIGQVCGGINCERGPAAVLPGEPEGSENGIAVVIGGFVCVTVIVVLLVTLLRRNSASLFQWQQRSSTLRRRTGYNEHVDTGVTV